MSLTYSTLVNGNLMPNYVFYNYLAQRYQINSTDIEDLYENQNTALAVLNLKTKY